MIGKKTRRDLAAGPNIPEVMDHIMGSPQAHKKAVATILLGAEVLVVVEVVLEKKSDRHPIASAMFAEKRDTSAGTARTKNRNKNYFVNTISHTLV